jgi:hypothetical protein
MEHASIARKMFALKANKVNWKPKILYNEISVDFTTTIDIKRLKLGGGHVYDCSSV